MGLKRKNTNHNPENLINSVDLVFVLGFTVWYK